MEGGSVESQVGLASVAQNKPSAGRRVAAAPMDTRSDETPPELNVELLVGDPEQCRHVTEEQELNGNVSEQMFVFQLASNLLIGDK